MASARLLRPALSLFSREPPNGGLQEDIRSGAAPRVLLDDDPAGIQALPSAFMAYLPFGETEAKKKPGAKIPHSIQRLPSHKKCDDQTIDRILGTKLKAVVDNVKTLERFGFSYERGGAHTSRTMMLAELRALLSYVATADASKGEYSEAVQAVNCLGKRSGRTRAITFRHLADLYALDPGYLIFRGLRFFWQRDDQGQPLLAALCAYSRDPLLRATAPFILGLPSGTSVTRQALEEFIDEQEPGRFSSATLRSTAQNISSSWTQSGHLTGRVRKFRARAVPTAGSTSFALFLGYVSGLRGESLFMSDYTRILDCSFDELIELAEDASRRGWISLKRVGRVVEVQFPNLITAQEMEWLREQN